METPPVRCAHDELIPTPKLIPNPRNPNQHPQKQIDLLTKIITHQGWRNPVVVSARSGFIIKGHARVMAARGAGWDVCPVDFQDYENEAAEWADMIADNQLQELSEMNLPELKDLLTELDDGAFDMDLTGFDPRALEMMMVTKPSALPVSELEGDSAECGRIIIVYNTPEEKDELCRRLCIEGTKVVYTFAEVCGACVASEGDGS